MINNKNMVNTINLPIIYHDYETYNWQEAPYGTIVADPKEGNIGIKLRYNPDERDPKDPFSTYGSNWVALKLRGDGTAIIEETSRMRVERFIFKKIDHVRGEVVYETNGKEVRNKLTNMDNLPFTLTQAEYIPGNNHIKALINNVIECTPSTRTLKEVSSTQFVLHPNDLEEGCEIDVYYVERFKVGNPYPRIFNQEEEPINPEPGDLWINSKPSEFNKTRLPLTVYQKLNYANKTIDLLIRTKAHSLIEIRKRPLQYTQEYDPYNEGEVIQTINNSNVWNIYKLPISYNDKFVIDIVVKQDGYFGAINTQSIVAPEQTQLTLIDTVINKDNIVFTFTSEPNANIKLFAIQDVSKAPINKDGDNIVVTVPRYLKSYTIKVQAQVAGKFMNEIDDLKIIARDPIKINLTLAEEKNHYIDLNNQYTTIKAEYDFDNPQLVSLSSNHTDTYSLKETLPNSSTWNINMVDQVQHISLVVADKDNNAISDIISTTVPAKRHKVNTLDVQYVSNKVLRGKNYAVYELTVGEQNSYFHFESPYEVRFIKQSGNVYQYAFELIGKEYTVTVTAEAADYLDIEQDINVEAQ